MKLQSFDFGRLIFWKKVYDG